MANNNTEYPSFIIVMWVLLERELRAVKLKSSLTEFNDLDDFFSCLKQKFKILKNVEPKKLLFYRRRLQHNTFARRHLYIFDYYSIKTACCP
ncbi:5492_t:CDS:1, partial [Dentiscutata erythropus]